MTIYRRKDPASRHLFATLPVGEQRKSSTPWPGRHAAKFNGSLADAMFELGRNARQITIAALHGDKHQELTIQWQENQPFG